MAKSIGYYINPQTQSDMVNPLQHALRRPTPVGVLSTLTTALDSVGATTYFFQDAIGSKQFETMIGNGVGDADTHIIAAQPFKGSCYQFYGFTSTYGNMTDPAKSLLLNLLAEPSCIVPIFLPSILH